MSNCKFGLASEAERVFSIAAVEKASGTSKKDKQKGKGGRRGPLAFFAAMAFELSRKLYIRTDEPGLEHFAIHAGERPTCQRVGE